MARLRRSAVAAAVLAWSTLAAGQACDKPVYLTFDTGHMGVANLVAEVLQRQQVKVTFFAAHERTKEGDGSLGETWAPWWKARAAEGHEFASHTFDHVYWRADLPGNPPRFRVRPSAGRNAGQDFTWTAAEYCAEIDRAARRLQEITGRKPLPLYRAPGGKTSPRLLEAAKSCGYAHVGWAPAGFLGDELPSEDPARRHPGGPPGHLVAAGPLGAGRAGAADHRPEGQGVLFRDFARPSVLPGRGHAR
jgi:peptidoglycan/xylan/chitin deacetylase (PgdA/CDA1 family)